MRRFTDAGAGRFAFCGEGGLTGRGQPAIIGVIAGPAYHKEPASVCQGEP